MEKTPKTLFREYLVQRAKALKGSFTLNALMKKIQWRSPEFQRVFSAVVEEAFSSEDSPFVEVGTSKDNTPVFIPKDELLSRCQSVFTKLPFVLSETETEEALKAISQSEQAHQESLIHSITSITCLIRFDQGSRGKPITLNLYQRFLASGNLLVTSSVLNHQMVFTSTSQKPEGKGRFRKEPQPEENPQKMIQSAVSVFLEEIGSLIFPESMLEAMSFKRYFAIENHNELEKLFFSLYPDVFHRSEGLWSFFPEQWLDLTAIIRRGISNRQSQENLETEIKNQHGFLNSKEVQWIADIIAQKIKDAPTDLQEKATVIVEPSEELPAVADDEPDADEFDVAPEAQEVDLGFSFDIDKELEEPQDLMNEKIEGISPDSGEEDSEDNFLQGIVTDYTPVENNEDELKEDRLKEAEPFEEDHDKDKDEDEREILKEPEDQTASQKAIESIDQSQPKAGDEEDNDLLKDLLIGFSSPQAASPSVEDEPAKESIPVDEEDDEQKMESPEPISEEKKQELVQEPVQEAVQEPAQEVVQKPVQEPVQKPVQKPVQESVDSHILSGKMIALLTDDQELFNKVLAFSKQMNIHLRDSLAYQPHMAILDHDYEYLSSIAKSSGIKVLTVSAFTEQYLQS